MEEDLSEMGEDLSNLSKKEFRKLAKQAKKKREQGLENLNETSKWKKLEFGDELLIGGAEGGAWNALRPS